MFSQADRTKQLWHFGILAIIILISMVLKIINEGALSYWLDEGYTAWFAELSFYEIWFWLPEVESHPPLYYSLVKLWGLIAADETGLWHRSLSIFVSLMLVFSSYFSTRKAAQVLGREISNAALFNSFLICFSPVLVWYSIEARPYILLFLAYSLSIFGLISIFSSGEERHARSWILFAFGALLTNWSHNLGGIFTATLFLSLLVHWIIDLKCEKNFIYRLLFCAVIVLALSLPLIIQIVRQVVYWDASSWVAEPTITGFVQILRRIFGFGFADKYVDAVVGEHLIIHTARIFLGLAIGILSLSIVLFGLYKMIQAEAFSLACFFVLSCFGVPVISLCISYFGPNIFIERTLLPCLIPYFMLLSVSIGYIEKPSVRSGIKGFYIVVLALGLFAILREGEKEPWDEIMTNLSIEVGENDTILLLPNDLYLPASLYIENLEITDRIESIPAKYPAVKFSDFYPDGFPAVPGIRLEDADLIRSLIKGKDRIFLVTRLEWLFDPNGVTRRVLSENFDPVTEKSWDQIHLERFDRK